MNTQSPDQKAPQLISASELMEAEPTPREWLVPNFIPHKTVSLLGGAGGTGKSLIALQLAAAVASGTDWLGFPQKQGPAFYLAAEDDRDELHRRVRAIADAKQIDSDQLTQLHFCPLIETLPLLVEGRHLKETRLFRQIRQWLEDHKPRLVVIDSAANFFGGDEIDRRQVTHFVSMLRSEAARNGCTVLLLAHPPKEPTWPRQQPSTEVGFSGSTAWENSARSRLTLRRSEGFTELALAKTNYGPAAAPITLQLSSGGFSRVSVEAVAALQAKANADIEQVAEEALAQLTAMDIKVRDGGGKTNFGATAVKKRVNQGLPKEALNKAADRKLRRGDWHLARYGPPAKGARRLVPGPAPDPAPSNDLPSFE